MSVQLFYVTTSLQPGVQMTVGVAEFEQLSDAGLVESFTETDVPDSQVLIVDDMPATPPAVGTVVFNRSIP